MYHLHGVQLEFSLVYQLFPNSIFQSNLLLLPDPAVSGKPCALGTDLFKQNVMRNNNFRCISLRWITGAKMMIKALKIRTRMEVMRGAEAMGHGGGVKLVGL